MPIASTAWLQDRQGREPLSPHLEIRTAQFFELSATRAHFGRLNPSVQRPEVVVRYY